MPKSILQLLLALFLISASQLPIRAQDYMYAAGNPTFSVNIPVENGFINVANGNLHLELSLASHKQRGMLKLNERLIYDSRIWKIIQNGSTYSWQPTNVANASAGWRFISGIEQGLETLNTVDKSFGCGQPGSYTYYGHTTIGWTDPSGSDHSFDAPWTTLYSDCPYTPKQESTSGYATDASGYSVQASGPNDDVPNTITIRDKVGTIVSANTISPVTDRFGNYWTKDSQGELIDDRGLVPVTVAHNGNVTTYNVLTSGGARQPYTATYGQISVTTAFGQSGVYEWSGTLTALQSLRVPDGTMYQFTYDGYGELASVTLPAGGKVVYGWQNVRDSYNNVVRWIGSRQLGSSPFTLFLFSTLNTCASGGVGCQEQTIVRSPIGDDRRFTFTLNNGSWNTKTEAFSGTVNTGTLLATVVSGFDFSQPCSSACTGSEYITPQTVTATLADIGQSVTTRYNYASAAANQILSIQKWDYYTGSLPAAPTLQTSYTYAGYDVKNEVTKDGTGNQIASTNYNYSSGSGAATATTGLPAHGTNNAGGPYLTSVDKWVNTDSSLLTTAFQNDDAGSVLSVTTNPLSNPKTTRFGYDPTDTFVTSTTLPTPSSGVALSSSSTVDASTGAPLNETDFNGQVTTYSNYDVFNRPGTIAYADGGSTSYIYTEILVRQLQNISSGAVRDTEMQTDTFGRPSRFALSNGQSTNPWYQADTCYDALGRVAYSSIPYAGTGFAGAQQCSGTQFAYDALGRPTSASNADGTTAFSYRGRATKVTDVNNVQTISQVDGLGRTVGICEVSSNSNMPGSGAPTSCGMDIAGTGFLTTYAYNLAGHKTTITQGAQTRVFQTDSIGRSVFTQEPERNVTTYTYAYNATGLLITRYRPSANQSSTSVTTSTATQLDSLGRTVSVNYSDSTPGKTFFYDAPYSPWTEASLQHGLKGRLSAALRGASAGTLFSYDAVGNVTANYECEPSGCGNAGRDQTLSYGHDWMGELTSESDGTGTTYTYGRSLAGEITGITASPSDATHLANIVVPGSVQNGPFGPTLYTLGSGLKQVNTYDSMGRINGGYTCGNSTAISCNGGTQFYGYQIGTKGQRVTSSSDTVLNRGSAYGYDEFNRLISSTTNWGTVQNLTWTYDRYGNRWQQNAPQGGPAPQLTFNTSNNQVVGNSYDAAGNLLSDSVHQYAYDADGNLVSVDNGSTAAYKYNALNQRVSVAIPARGTTEFAYDSTGHRISTWNAPTGSLNEGNVYWDGRPVAFKAGGSTHFEHQDWQGTERLRTSYNGTVDSNYVSLPFADGYHASGNDWDWYHFAGLTHDPDSSTEAATFRQYSSLQGHWMSPDPYDGSYDFGTPQSFNRYTYVSNNPLSLVDPDGEDEDNPGYCDPEYETCDPGDPVPYFPVGGVPDIGVFDGSLDPRPEDTASPNWDDPLSESLGLPKGAKLPGGGLWDLLGLPQQQCEFGVCGFQQSGSVPNVGVNCRGIQTDHLGLILAQHCDATVSIGDGWLYSLSAGPIGDRLRGFVTKTKTLPTGSTYYWKGRDGLGLAQCLISAATTSQTSPDAPQYHPITGPNSNIWLNSIFSSCGVNLGINTHGPYF